jgi:hypothetical protein
MVINGFCIDKRNDSHALSKDGGEYSNAKETRIVLIAILPNSEQYHCLKYESGISITLILSTSELKWKYYKLVAVNDRHAEQPRQ